MKSPSLTVTRLDTFAPLEADWKTLLPRCSGDTIFLTWEWQSLWWSAFPEGELHLVTVQDGEELVGLAPLIRVGDAWGFNGGVEVADFLDVLARSGHEATVAAAVLDYVQAHDGRIELRNLRPNAVAATTLADEACRRGALVQLEPEDVSPRLDLPADWDSYLQRLSKKDRHELRRKLRRLYASGTIGYGAVDDPGALARDVGDFLRLHRLSAEAKAAFMTPRMEAFFRSLVERLTARGWLRLYFLSVDGKRAASVILFDYGGEYLLYNSGYDPAYAHLSVGLLLKAFCIREAIERGRRAFDFLQGNEPYKYDLGGADVPIFRLRISFDAPPGVMRSNHDDD